MAGLELSEIEKKLQAFKAAALPVGPGPSSPPPPAPPPPPPEPEPALAGMPCYSKTFSSIVNGLEMKFGPVALKFDSDAVGQNGFQEIVIELMSSIQQCEVA